MTSDTSGHDQDARGRPLASLEAAIRASTDDEHLAKAREILRAWLFDQLGAPIDGSIGDAIARLSDSSHNRAGAAAVISRCLAIQRLVPNGGANKPIDRPAVLLFERGLPEVAEFLGINAKSQTYENFAILREAHSKITALLKPVGDQYSGIESIVGAKRLVLSALNHGMVRRYCDPFHLPEIRSVFEVILSKVSAVSLQQSSLVSDLDDCQNSIEAGYRVGIENGSFLYYDYLLPFLDNVRIALDEFINSTRGKFVASIIRAERGMPLQKKYPIQEDGRTVEIKLPLRNVGPGMAIDVRISASSESDSILVADHEVVLGTVSPGDFTFNFEAMVVSSASDFDGSVIIEWGEVGNPSRKSEIFAFSVQAQSAEIDWNSLAYWKPYSTDVATGGDFVGRNEITNALASKILRTPMEPFYITGQKRVGKTSLALACVAEAKHKVDHHLIEDCYILWGAIAHVDPSQSLRALGEYIEQFLTESIPANLRSAPGNFEGSLSPLIRTCDVLAKISPDKKFVIIIDEFDEIHPELYLQGNLAETFFANIRAIATKKNICLILVGGENMPYLMDRQGQKLNKFSRYNLSYFDRAKEWDDFRELIRRPTTEVLTWYDDAISDIFNATNGNPYFAKILCSFAVENAVRERDTDLTTAEIADVTGLAVSALDSNSFAHLWQDGIFRSPAEREPDILRRGRVLVAAGRCLRKGLPLNLENILDNKGQTSLVESDVPPVLNDFVRRDVLQERDGVYKFTLPLFQYWLADVGMARLVSDALGEELSLAIQGEEEAAFVRSEELVELSRKWPTYRGKHVGAEEIRTWLQQVESYRDQRVLFKILQNTRVLSEVEVRERLKAVHSQLRRSLPEFVLRKLSDRRRDVVVTYLDGEGKSGQAYASLYAEENGISVERILPERDFSSKLAELREGGKINAVVIVDDIAATGKTMAENIVRFVEEHRKFLTDNEVTVFAATLVATKDAMAKILKSMENIDGVKVDFRTGQVLGEESFAFPSGLGFWGSAEESDRARALCIDLGSRIYKKSPLGFGNQGLLLVFPTTAPNNTLPILHTSSRLGGKRWSPLFERVVN